MKNKVSNRWTSAQLVHLSESLASAYSIGLKSNIQKDQGAQWNSQQLLNLSVAKSFPFN